MRPGGYEQPADLGAVDRPQAGTERTEDQVAEAAQLCSRGPRTGAASKPKAVQTVERSSAQSIPRSFISILSVCILDNMHSHD